MAKKNIFCPNRTVYASLVPVSGHFITFITRSEAPKVDYFID